MRGKRSCASQPLAMATLAVHGWESEAGSAGASRSAMASLRHGGRPAPLAGEETTSKATSRREAPVAGRGTGQDPVGAVEASSMRRGCFCLEWATTFSLFSRPAQGSDDASKNRSCASSTTVRIRSWPPYAAVSRLPHKLATCVRGRWMAGGTRGIRCFARPRFMLRSKSPRRVSAC